MSHNIKVIHNQRHLPLSDRVFIEQGLITAVFLQVYGSKSYGKDPSTISKKSANKLCSYSKWLHTDFLDAIFANNSAL